MSAAANTARRWAPPLVGFGSLLLVLAAVEFLIRVGVINRYIVPLPSEVAASFTRVILEEDILHRLLITAWECLAAGLLLTLFGIAIAWMQRVSFWRRLNSSLFLGTDGMEAARATALLDSSKTSAMIDSGVSPSCG